MFGEIRQLEDGTLEIVGTHEGKEIRQPITLEFLEKKFYMMDVALANIQESIDNPMTQFKKKGIEDNKKLSEEQKRNLSEATDKAIIKIKEESKKKLETFAEMRKDFVEFLSKELPDTYDKLMQNYDERFKDYQHKFRNSKPEDDL